MKRFLKYAALFCAPLLLFFVVLEIVVTQIPNSYSYKYNFIKENGERIKLIAIGHSQLYDGFKPESISLPSFNLCNSAQSYTDNYYILKELLPSMPKLQVVIMPIGYLNVGVKGTNDVLSERSCYYHKYMNLNYDGKLPLKDRFECFDVKRACKKIYLYYFRDGDIVGCDSLGRRSTQYLHNRKHELGYDLLFETYTLASNTGYRIKDENYLIEITKMLQERHIRLILVSPPYYWSCFKGENKAQQAFLKDYIQSFCKKYSVEHIDMEHDNTFEYDDFFNESHLSEYGAEKFTQKINEYLIKHRIYNK